MNKPFDQVLYDKNDRPAKIIAMEIYAARGMILEIGTQYGVDLICRNDNIVVEVEMSGIDRWRGDYLRHRTLHIPKRKAKFMSDNGSGYFITIREDGDAAYEIPFSIARECSVISKDTKYMKNEEFIDIPIHLCRRLLRREGWSFHREIVPPVFHKIHKIEEEQGMFDFMGAHDA